MHPMDMFDMFRTNSMFRFGGQREVRNTPGNPNQNVNRRKKRAKKAIANKSKKINRK